VGGLVGSLGGRLLDDVAKRLVDEVISNIKKAIEQEG
jgi:carbon monoxide dehydrogenase subunit G